MKMKKLSLLFFCNIIVFNSSAEQQPISVKINNCLITLAQGDITKERVDAIVNAANAELKHIGGVARAISDAAGPNLQIASTKMVKKSGPITVGQSGITPAFNLEKQGVRAIIHSVGPNCTIEEQKKEWPMLLAKAYLNALILADEAELTSIAFPAISTNIFACPIEQAAPKAIRTAVDYIHHYNQHLKEIKFVLFNDNDFKVYKTALEKGLTRPVYVEKQHTAEGQKPSSEEESKKWWWQRMLPW